MRPTLNAEEPINNVDTLKEKFYIKDLEHDTEDNLLTKNTLFQQFKLKNWRSLLVNFHSLFLDHNITPYWYESTTLRELRKKEWVFVNCWSLRSIDQKFKKIESGDIGIYLIYLQLQTHKLSPNLNIYITSIIFVASFFSCIHFSQR